MAIGRPMPTRWHLSSQPPPAVGAGTFSVQVSRTAIIVDGQPLVALRDGAIDASEIEGGALGLKVSKLAAFTTAWIAGHQAQTDPLVVLWFDRSLRFDVFHRVVYSIKRSRVRRFALAVSTGSSTATLPFTLPDRSSLEGGVRLIVSILTDRLTVWSFSGLEGTLPEPKLIVRTPAELRPALAEIVERRWPTGSRPPQDEWITLMIHARIPMQTVAEVMAMVRAETAGTRLFSEVMFSPMVD